MSYVDVFTDRCYHKQRWRLMKNCFPSDSYGTACSPVIHGILREIRKSGVQSNKNTAHSFFLAYQTPERNRNSDFL